MSATCVKELFHAFTRNERAVLCRSRLFAVECLFAKPVIVNRGALAARGYSAQ